MHPVPTSVRSILALVILAIASLTAAATAQNGVPRFSNVFADGMVLQRDRTIRVWGWAGFNYAVEVTISKNGEPIETKFGRGREDGAWAVELAPLPAGGPYTLSAKTIEGEVEISDVLVGEVWIASGQSNMRWPLRLTENARAHADNASDPELRFMTVLERSSPEPLEEPLAVEPWQSATPESVWGFSGVAYHFATELRDTLDVPVGIVLSAWGGTQAEAWTPREQLAYSPKLKPILDRWTEPEGTLEERQAQIAELRAQRQRAERDLWSQRTDAETAITSGLADVEWITRTVPGSSAWPRNNEDGVFWYTRTVEIPERWRGQPLVLNLGPIDDFDVTYIDGIEVGRTSPAVPNAWSTPREYRIPAGWIEPGVRTISVRVVDTHAAGGLTGGADAYAIGPFGDEGDRISLAGEWKAAWIRDAADAGLVELPNLNDPRRPSGLYNAMIHPIRFMPVRGVIWYQGEGNAARAEQYATLFPTMINAWRDVFGAREMPFLFVQLANFRARADEPGESAWAELRFSQSRALALPNTAMATAIDIGDADDIHPRNKLDVGKRLALAARRVAYGEADLVHSGPMPRGMEITDDGAIELTFRYAEGLATSDGGPVKGFAIAGEDRQWHWADAVIEGETVRVSSDAVPEPVAVRFGWADSPEVNLVNGAGLPAPPFKSDRWPGITAGKE